VSEVKKNARKAIDEDKVSGKIYDRKLFARLLKYGKPYALLIVLAVGMIIVAAGLETLGPYLIQQAVDTYILPGDLEGLHKIVVLYFLLLIGVFIIRFSQILLAQFIGQKVIYDLRNDIFVHLQRLHQQYFDRNPVGRLITRVTTDVQGLNDMFTQGLVMIFGDIFLIIGIVIMMLSINTKLALWTLSIVPLLFMVSFLFRKKVRDAYGQIRYFIARINSYLQEHISGMEIVQLFNREKDDFDKFKKINWDHTAAFIRTIFYYALFYPTMELLGATAMALIIFRGGWMIHDGALTIGVLIAFIQYARMFFRPISDLSDKYNILQGAFAASERIFKLLDTTPAIQSPPNGHRQDRLRGEIRFENVSFSYVNEPVLQNINLEIQPGKKVALVGHTGAGKTTIIRLLGRFYDVTEGRILVDGVDVREWDLQSLRSRMAIVLQDVFLFSGTILENIRMGREDISEAAVIKAAKQVNAHDFILRIPGGYQAQIRERGSNLSVGQKQLISLARALVMNPDVLLLDEATANIDSESEALIQQALEIVLENRTAIVIAHRLSTIQHMDQIVVLHKGRVRETGTHQQLLKARGLYYKLYQLQYQGRSDSSEVA
jgi:ATP-binding cassette subfamily B protein